MDPPERVPATRWVRERSHIGMTMTHKEQTVIDFASLARKAASENPAPVAREVIRATPVASAAYLMKADEDWTAEDLRDYVMGQIERFHGPQLRNPMKEGSIFKSFLSRYKAQGPAIARFAFEVERGMWRRAPISATRFCRASDEYFADQIAERLV